MGVTVEEMRKYIATKYDSPEWKKQVKDMPDNQVMAIYFKFQGKKKKRKIKALVPSMPLYEIPERYRGMKFISQSEIENLKLAKNN